MSLPCTLALPSGSGAGCIVLVEVPDARAAPTQVEAALLALPVAERALAARWAPRRQATFAAGRAALRRALREVGVDLDDVAVGRDDRGAPVLPSGLPPGLRVSITHKDTVAGALVVVDAAADVTLGIDLELDDGRARSETDALARQVLVASELAGLPDDDAARRRALFERFSLKEALYKALDPFLRRYIGFTEVTVDVAEDRATFDAGFFAPDGVLGADGAVISVPALPEVVLTMARVRRRR